MTAGSDDRRWRILSTTVEVRSPWLTLLGERLEDDAGRPLDYWRIEKPDSVLVIVVQAGRLLFPVPAYRPGVGAVTLDLAGGRLEAGRPLLEVAEAILRREFGLPEGGIAVSWDRLNDQGWAVDSSTSCQRVYGVVARLRAEPPVSETAIGARYRATAAGGRQALRDLTCLQCRAVLYDWIERQSS